MFFRGEVSEGRGRSAASSCRDYSHLLFQRPGSSDQLGHSEYNTKTAPKTGTYCAAMNGSNSPVKPRYMSASGIKQSYIEFSLCVEIECVFVGQMFRPNFEVNLLHRSRL